MPLFVRAQTAYIPDAWWTFQQDCNGDGCKAGTLANDFARLNWTPAVTNCDGTLTTFEVVSFRPCGTTTWTPIYTNAPHAIAGCRSSDAQHVDIQMGASCTCRDYMVQIYRQGHTTPDYARSPANDADLSQHNEQLLSEDFCLSDFFETAVVITGTTGSIEDNNSFATKEPEEPNHAGNPGGHSLWFSWTATTNVPVTFDTLGSGFDTLLAVYTGEDVDELTVVTNNDDIAGSTNRFSRVTFTPVIGMTYHIAVDGFGGATGIVQLNWNQSGTALPDLIIWGPAVSPVITSEPFGSGDCEIVEGCLNFVGTHRLLRFSAETRNVGSGDLILGSPATNSLFVWAQCHGHYHFEQYMQYSLFDTNGNLAASGHKVGFCVLDDHAWSPTAKPNAKYYCTNQGLQAGWSDVYGYTLSCQYIDITFVPPGNYTLQLIVNPDALITEANYDNNTVEVPVTIPPVTCTNAPFNDNFTNAMGFTDIPFTFTEANNCAGKESGEPNHAGNSGGHSVWFNWNCNSNQNVIITTRRSGFDTLLAVYTGNTLAGLTQVAANDDLRPGVSQSQLSFSAHAGTTYHIAVDGKNGAAGTAVINVGAPANDDFETPFHITGASGTTNGFTFTASKETNEPAHASDVGGRSIWYQWTAPASGPVDINTLGSDFDTTLGVYTNAVMKTTNAPVASNDDDPEGGGALTSRVSFYATSNVTYYIAIDGFGGDAGNTVLNWNMVTKLDMNALPDGTVQINLHGVDWQRYILQGTTNFQNWDTNAAAITMSGGTHSYTNTPGSNSPPDMEFYRALRVP